MPIRPLSDPTPSHARAFRSARPVQLATRASTAILSGFVLILLSLHVAAMQAHSSDEPSHDAKASITRRAKGVAYLDLPFRVRARIDLTYTDDLYPSEVLARPYASALTGPRLQDEESVERRFALTHSLGKNVEIGIVWLTRSPLAPADLFDFGHQTLGAMIRIVP